MDKQSAQGKNYRTHVRTLTLSKLADGLFDPKIVLSWLLLTLGSSATWIGLLVPVREAGALLPQLVTAEPIRRLPVRKWAWIWGSVGQGLAAIGIAVAALTLEGERAGMVVVALVAFLAIARSVSSVSYKDVLGKTVEKSRRGQVSGTATSVAAGGVLLFGTLLVLGVLDRFVLVVSALVVAGGLWLLAAATFTRLSEDASLSAATREPGVFRRYWRYLTTDHELQRLLLVRGLLVATAIAPPYLLLLAGEQATGMWYGLGSLVIASALAALFSGAVWGKLADYSTATTLSLAGGLAACTLAAALYVTYIGFLTQQLVLPLLLFFIMIAHHGVRIGRTTHLVNIGNEDTRTGYTAVSNTVIGIVLLGTGLFGVLAELVGVEWVVGLLAVMAGLATLAARFLTA